MEPQKTTNPWEPGRESQRPPRQPERKRRFQIVKLEERIAPGGGSTKNCTQHGESKCVGRCYV
jgi:hypothetical protein